MYSKMISEPSVEFAAIMVRILTGLVKIWEGIACSLERRGGVGAGTW